MGLDAMIFVFWMFIFKPTCSLSTFTFIKRLFSSSSLSAIRVVSSAYLRLLIFLPAILIPACASSHIGHYQILSRVPWAIQQVLVRYLFYIECCVYVNPNLPICPSPTQEIHTFLPGLQVLHTQDPPTIPVLPDTFSLVFTILWLSGTLTVFPTLGTYLESYTFTLWMGNVFPISYFRFQILYHSSERFFCPPIIYSSYFPSYLIVYLQVL